jgi:hypothetical protein
MVRFTDAVLRTHLGCVEGFADEQVTIVNPAMGTVNAPTSHGPVLLEFILMRAGRPACLLLEQEAVAYRKVGCHLNFHGPVHSSV